MRVKALQEMYYNRAMVTPGTIYEMDDREEPEAKILAAIGKIEILQAKPQQKEVQQKASTYNAAALQPEEPSKSVGPMTTEDMPSTRRYYRRRDMKAEE